MSGSRAEPAEPAEPAELGTLERAGDVSILRYERRLVAMVMVPAASSSGSPRCGDYDAMETPSRPLGGRRT